VIQKRNDIMAGRKREDDGEFAAGWYVKFGDLKKAADYAESRGKKRLAQKLRKMAAEDREKK